LGAPAGKIIYDFLNETGNNLTKIDESCPMSNEKIATSILRMAIRGRIRAEISQRSIALLIQDYATPDCSDHGGEVLRLPVELIPNKQRPAFLGALGKLPNHHPIVVTKTQG
jgi:hypothetical protein